MTGGWDESAERERRGLPSAQDQKLHGLTAAQEVVYAQMLKDRKVARAVYSRERATSARRGQAIVERFAQAGISTSYEWRSSVPLVEMGLEEAERLLQAFSDLAEAYDIASTAGRDLSDFIARALAPDSGSSPS